MTALAGVTGPVGGVEATDAQLVALATAGDREAFRLLFDRHAHRVAGACRKKARSQADVDDAVQEAFARALANLDQLRNPDNFGAWVRSIAVRAVLDHHRAAKRVLVVDDEVHAERADAGPLPDEIVESWERDASVHDWLAQLGERDRQALYLRHIEEAPVSAVADQLGLTEGSTRVMLTRARDRLRLVASGLGALLPMPWRRWLRDHMHITTPAMEVLAVAVAVGLSGGFAAPPVQDDRPPVIERAADTKARPAKASADRTRDDDRSESRRRGPTAPTTTSGLAGAAGGGNSSSADADRPRVLERVGGRVKNSVKVQREYPDDSEEVLDVTVFSNEEELSTGMYGNELNDAGKTTVKAVEGLLGGAED